MDWRRLNVLSLVATGLFVISTLYPWWGLDISGPSYGLPYSFQWTMWKGPLVTIGQSQAYSWVNNLNQVLSSGTSILGTLALVTAALALAGVRPRRFRFLVIGFALSVLIPFVYIGVVNVSVAAGHNATISDCISGVSGMCVDGAPPGPLITESWGFQTGFYIYAAGIIAAFCALVYDRDLLHFRAPATESKTAKAG